MKQFDGLDLKIVVIFLNLNLDLQGEKVARKSQRSCSWSKVPDPKRESSQKCCAQGAQRTIVIMLKQISLGSK